MIQAPFQPLGVMEITVKIFESAMQHAVVKATLQINTSVTIQHTRFVVQPVPTNILLLAFVTNEALKNVRFL